MKNFKQLRSELTEAASYDDHVKRLKGVKKGTKVSFSHSTTGEKIHGEYAGLKQKGGRSYAHVHGPKASYYVPVHQVESVVYNNDDLYEENLYEAEDRSVVHVVHHPEKGYMAKGGGYVKDINHRSVKKFKSHDSAAKSRNNLSVTTNHIDKKTGKQVKTLHTSRHSAPGGERVHTVNLKTGETKKGDYLHDHQKKSLEQKAKRWNRDPDFNHVHHRVATKHHPDAASHINAKDKYFE